MDSQNLEGGVAQRLDAAVALAHLSGRPVFALASKPQPDSRFRNLFGSREASLVHNFEHPPVLRRAGFSLEHDGNSRIVMGELRRVLIPSWKVMELWRDGVFLYAVDALVQPFWGSPRKKDGSLQMNPLALAEPIYLFALLSNLIYEESVTPPHRIEYRIRLDCLIQNGTTASLSEGALDPFFFGNPLTHPAPASTFDRTIVWQTGKIVAEVVAYELVKEVYNWFGISDDGIPYTVNSDGTVAIDPQALTRAGGQ